MFWMLAMYLIFGIFFRMVQYSLEYRAVIKACLIDLQKVASMYEKGQKLKSSKDFGLLIKTIFFKNSSTCDVLF